MLANPPNMAASNQPAVKRQPGWKPMPRPPSPTVAAPYAQTPGYGTRSMWPLPPVGEAQRRDPHVGDPTTNKPPGISQANASPSIAKRKSPTGYIVSPGNGIVSDGYTPYLVYLKTIGKLVTHTLASNIFGSWVDARWRLGGIGYPPDFGFGPGYHGDAQTIYPNNPQTYLRNPGIIPLLNNPSTWRYSPTGGIQDVGPSIAAVGNILTAPGLSS